MTHRYYKSKSDGRMVFHADHVDSPEHFRPVAVIDPTDREAVERLAKCYREVTGEADLTDEPWSIPGLRMQAALREFAAPTPPKPEEPSGLGAVVEDAEGWLWTRTLGKEPAHRRYWIACTGSFQQVREWADLDVARVVHEGVTA